MVRGNEFTHTISMPRNQNFLAHKILFISYYSGIIGGGVSEHYDLEVDNVASTTQEKLIHKRKITKLQNSHSLSYKKYLLLRGTIVGPIRSKRMSDYCGLTGRNS